MATTNQDFDTRSRKYCPWGRAPTTGTTFEGLLFGVVGLFMVATVASLLYRGEITNAARSHDPTAATPLLHTVVASAGADTHRPAEATNK